MQVPHEVQINVHYKTKKDFPNNEMYIYKISKMGSSTRSSG